MPDHEYDDLRDLPILREIGVELRALAAEEDHRVTQRFARFRRWRGRRAILGLTAALVVVAPATAAISGLWSPDVPPMPPMTTVTTAATVTSTPAGASACAPTPPSVRDARVVTSVQPPREMLDAFGVLRTRQTADDRAGLRAPDASLAPGKVAADYVRLLGKDAAGRDRWLLPSLVTDERHCQGAATTSLWMLSMVGAGGAANDYRYVIAHGMVGASDPDNVKNESVVTGLVPDGAASVTVAYANDQGAPRTWPVRRNLFSYTVRLPVEQAYTPKVRWNGTTGR